MNGSVGTGKSTIGRDVTVGVLAALLIGASVGTTVPVVFAAEHKADAAAGPTPLAQANPYVVQVPVGYFITGLVIWLLTTPVTWYVASRRSEGRRAQAIEALTASVGQMREDFKDLARRVAEQGEKITAEERGRYELALTAAQSYASREEYVRAVGTMTAFERQVVTRLDEIRAAIDGKFDTVYSRINKVNGDAHNRIGTVEQRVAALERKGPEA